MISKNITLTPYDFKHASMMANMKQEIAMISTVESKGRLRRRREGRSEGGWREGDVDEKEECEEDVAVAVAVDDDDKEVEDDEEGDEEGDDGENDDEDVNEEEDGREEGGIEGRENGWRQGVEEEEEEKEECEEEDGGKGEGRFGDERKDFTEGEGCWEEWVTVGEGGEWGRGEGKARIG